MLKYIKKLVFFNMFCSGVIFFTEVSVGSRGVLVYCKGFQLFEGLENLAIRVKAVAEKMWGISRFRISPFLRGGPWEDSPGATP